MNRHVKIPGGRFLYHQVAWLEFQTLVCKFGRVEAATREKNYRQMYEKLETFTEPLLSNLHSLNCPLRVFDLTAPHVIQRKTGEERMVGISSRLYSWKKSRFDRFHFWRPREASKETRARALVGSTSLPWALSLVQILISSVPEKRLFLPSYSLINSLPNVGDSDLMQIEDPF